MGRRSRCFLWTPKIPNQCSRLQASNEHICSADRFFHLKGERTHQQSTFCVLSAQIDRSTGHNNSRQQLPAAVICNALPLLVGAQLMQTSRSAPAQARELPSQPQGMLVALSFAGDVLVTSKYVLGPKIKMCLFVCFYLTYVPVAPNGIVT